MKSLPAVCTFPGLLQTLVLLCAVAARERGTTSFCVTGVP